MRGIWLACTFDSQQETLALGPLVIWNLDQDPEQVQVKRMAWLGANGVQVPRGRAPAGSPVILTVPPPGDCAVLLVPDARAGDAAVNRIPVGAGLHRVHHGDLLEVAGRRFWVEVRRVARSSRFDTRFQGDLFCAATRARLKDGDPIVTCAGKQGQACGLVYSRPAWESLDRCPGCGASPHPEPWTPPREPRSSSLADLLARLGGKGEAP